MWTSISRVSISSSIAQLPANQAIFRIHAGVCLLFREFLQSQGFLEIQSSKFQESSTESGAEVFKVDYFRRPAFLAQSPQLAKQMCIAADMERVFEIGPGASFLEFAVKLQVSLTDYMRWWLQSLGLRIQILTDT